MAEHIQLGQKGENAASEYLIKKGYKILDRNWRYDRAELDIVAMDGETLVIVEVKTRAASIYEEPSESITSRKIRHLVDAAEAYIIEHDIDAEARFDVISIKWFGEGRYDIDHRIEAFTPPVN